MCGLIARLAGVAMALLDFRPSMAGAAIAGAPPAGHRRVDGAFRRQLLTILRTAMAEHAASFPEFDLQFADAQGDVAGSSARFRTSRRGAAAIIVNAADTSATRG